MIKISRWSGKCDCRDVLIDIHNYTLEELQNNVKIYVGDSDDPLHINSMEDLIPYYPYIIGSSFHNNVDRTAVIHLSSESWVDTEERQLLEFYKKQLVKMYKRCKRKKQEFDPEDAGENVSLLSTPKNKNTLKRLARRVVESGAAASLDGLHFQMHEIYRRELVDEMLKNGLNPADYGYGRFVEEEENQI